MYNVLIIEDDAEQAWHLEQMVNDSPEAGRLAFLETPPGDVAAAMDALPEADIVFADIKLNATRTGIDLIYEQLDRSADTQVIYVSGYVEYAPDAYRTPHTWFLTKPVDPSLLSQALSSALANLDALSNRPFIVRSHGLLLQVTPSQVLYIESSLRKLIIREHNRTIETYAKLSEIEASLPTCFVRCHKSYLVNMSHIADFGRRQIRLFNGEEVPVSQRYANEARDRFVEFVSREL